MSRVIDAIIRLTDNFTSPMNKTITAMTNGSKAAVKMGKDIEKAGKKISDVGGKLTATITMPVIGAGVAAGKMALDFENGIAKVSTIADTSAMSINQIKKQTIDLSNQMGISVSDISDAQYEAISSGVATAKSLSLVKTAAMDAKGGFTDTTTAINGLTSVYNSYQGKVDYSKISDQMMVAQNLGKTTFNEMATSMGNVTPIANSLNVSTDSLFSSIAVLTANGIGTSESITGLKAAFSNILKPTDDASKTAKKLGIDFSAAHLKAVGWTKFLGEIKNKVGDNSTAMASLFGSVEALNSVTLLSGSGYDSMIQSLDQMNKSTGLTQKTYEAMLTPSERWNMALNKLKNSGIQVGEKLLPVFEKVTGIVSKVADKFNGLSDAQVNQVMKYAAMAAAVGPLIFSFGKIVTVSGKALKVFNLISKAGGILKFAIAGIASPVGIVIIALLAIIGIVIIVRKHWGLFKAALQTSMPVFQRVHTEIQNIIKKLQPFIALVKKVAPIVANVFGKVITIAVAAAVAAFAGLLTGIEPIFNGVTKIFGGIIKFITGIFTGNWKKAWEGVKEIFSGEFDVIKGIATSVVNGISAAINTVTGTINKAGFTIPKWVPVVGGKKFAVHIPTIPMLAKGTSNWSGGIAQVHEKGGEIIDLPKGSRVYPHDKSVSMAKTEKSASISCTIAKLADQIIVREDADIDKIADALYKKLKSAAGNMGGVPSATLS